MAREYDGKSSSSIRDELMQERQQQTALYKKIELGVIIGAFTIAGLSVVVNIGKCVSYTGKINEYNATRVESETKLTELNAKLQDPASQNYEYKDPIVGNMTEEGQAIALMQNQLIVYNQLIVSNQLHNNMPNMAARTSPRTDTVTESDHDSPSTMTADGPVTLGPEDFAPTQTEIPDTETVEKPDTLNDSVYEYTPIPDFNTDFNTNPTSESGTVSNNGVDQTASQNVTGNDLANLIKEFKEKHYAQPITNVDGGDVLWSWYGNWEFSGSYDYSVNEIPDMKAVWICYDTSDTAHLRPLAFVKANYSQSTKKFTNFEAVYTQSYVKKADSQAKTWGDASDASTSETAQFGTENQSNNDVILFPDGMTNTAGSENEFQINIVEDDVTETGAVTITPDSSTASSGSTGASGNTNSSTGNTTPANNPPGQASWSPGSGAGTTPADSGNWIPNGGSTVNPDGTWTPNSVRSTGP